MQVLAIDCTAKSVSVALARDGKLIFEAFLNIPLTHSETLMPLVEQALENCKLSLKDIDAFAITAGPGSFTGVRIGMSAVKGLAFAENKPVFSFSVLEVMALAFKLKGFSGIICSLMDARCNQFYNAVFEINNGEVKRITEDRIIVINDLEKELETLYNNKSVIFVGDGAELFVKNASKPFGSTAPQNLLIQSAAPMAVAASIMDIKNALSPESIMPVYLRKSQAERERLEKNK